MGVVKFSFLLSGGEEITRMVEINGEDTINFVGIRRKGEDYVFQIGPHTIELSAEMLKGVIEKLLLLYPDDEEMKRIIESLAIAKPWIFEKLSR